MPDTAPADGAADGDRNVGAIAPQAVATLLRSLKSKRTQVKSQATRYQTYIRDVNIQEVTIAELRQRLQRAQETWEIFNTAQSAIEDIEDDSTMEAAHEEQRSTFEAKYFDIVSKLETLLDQKMPTAQVTAPVQQTERPATPASNAVNDHLKLPRVTLPTFSGNYEKWTPFRNIFQSLIDQNSALPDVQKMQYLIASLKGEAHDIISALEASAENYKEAWDMLKERYDDSGLIIQKHIRALFEQPSIPKENHIAVRRLLDCVLKHLRALKALKRPTDNWDDLMIHLITSKLDPTTCKEWETSVKRGDVPTFKQLTDFLSQRCRALEATTRTQRPTTTTTAQEKSGQGKGVASHIATVTSKCAFCAKEDHIIYKCSEFLQLGIEQRIQEAKARKLCLNCLKAAAHPARRCGAGPCRKCNKRHNTLVHLEQSSGTQAEVAAAKTQSTGGEKVTATSVNHASVTQERQVLLATAVVNILDVKGNPQPYRALLDSGSQSCFITTKCAKELGLKQHSLRIPICGLGELSTQTRSITKITLQSRINGFQAKLDCLVIERITQALPVNRINLENLEIPDGIILADPNFNQTSDIDVLLGAEIFMDLLCIGRIKRVDQPVWQKTLLGWIVSGNFMTPQELQNGTICNLAINEQINTNLPRFWQLEHIERQNTRTPEERVCEGHFGRTYKRIADERFVVTLPTREEKLQNLGKSRDIAIMRFKMLERKLSQKPHLKKQYTEFIHEYLRLGHMRELTNDSPTWDIRPHFYLPHHCVIKESSATATKLRVVFDASSKTTSGISLNDALMVGPVVQQTLFAILLRFRSFEYALTADIAKMYRQILVNESQVPLQRIVWRDHTTEDIKTYELLTLTYGTATASFLATKVIQQLADLEENSFPKDARAARRDFYVDDLITVANTMEEARMIRDQTTALCLKGGFVLRQWTSSCEELLKDIPKASTANAILELDKDGTSKALGVKWNPRSDLLQYSIAMESPGAKPCTKRTILTNIAQIFDPLGLLGPVILIAKIMIQRLWRLKIDWDESLPADTYTEWASYVLSMRALDGFSVQRKVITSGSNVQLDLHGFCDASERAYGACIYIRSSRSHEFLQAQLICPKSRVAPLKTISIPRLELCGAQLLTQLMGQVKVALELHVGRTYYWTDSSIVLSWIKAVDKKLPVFVAHRVGEIQEMTAMEDWNHVGTKENPADLVSRGVTPDELKNSHL